MKFLTGRLKGSTIDNQIRRARSEKEMDEIYDELNRQRLSKEVLQQFNKDEAIITKVQKEIDGIPV
jgi:hypothetical protein